MGTLINPIDLSDSDNGSKGNSDDDSEGNSDEDDDGTGIEDAESSIDGFGSILGGIDGEPSNVGTNILKLDCE